MRLPEPDKLAHYAAGSLAAFAGAVFFGFVGGAAACLGAAVLREVYNKHQGGEFSVADIAWTVGGGVPVLGALWL